MAEDRSAQAVGPLALGLAWAVHAFTASGAVVAVAATLAAARGEFRVSALWMLVALAIDAVDGSLARRARVAEVLPAVDGRRLDDLVDYLNYVVVPALFLVWLGAVPHWLWTSLPLLSSAYGFSQNEAKTGDHFFLGFPSYWNVVAIYALTLEVSGTTMVAWLMGLSVAVFVPIKYLYPSRMRLLYWTTNGGALVWMALVAVALAFPERAGRLHLTELSLLYPAYYVALSLWLGGIQRRR